MKQPTNYEEALEYLYNRVGDYLETEGPCDKIVSPDDAVCGSWGTGCFYCTMADAAEMVRAFNAARHETSKPQNEESRAAGPALDS